MKCSIRSEGLGTSKLLSLLARNAGKTAHAAEPRVSVRAMILSLGRFEIAPKEQVKALEKAWAKYREANELDIEGKGRDVSIYRNRRPE